MSCGKPAYVHMEGIEEGEGQCRNCHQRILWGRTVNGARAPFDLETLCSHWITCPKAAEARQMYPKKRAH